MMDSASELWAIAPHSVSLAVDEVHVYHVCLDHQPEAGMHTLTAMLAPDERTRAQRFHLERDRQRYVVGRASLRMLLARYEGTEPQRLKIRYGWHGKPELAPTHQASTTTFNVAHSDGIALYAIARNRAIGIDVERVRSFCHAERVAERYFAAEEREALHRLSGPTREVAFLTCWTRKEAYIKALGSGMSIPLDSFAVSVAPTDSARLIHVAGGVQDAARWSLYPLALEAGFVATVAVEGPPISLRCWSWSYWST